jgi:hypothetical protein
MAQMHTLEAFLLALPAPFTPGWPDVTLYSAPDDADLADDEDEDEEDEEDDDDEDEDEDDEDEDEDEEDEEDSDEEDDEDEDEEEEVEEGPKEARTARGQLKRQNGHPRGGHSNG